MWLLEFPGHELWKMSSQANRIPRPLGQNESLMFFCPRVGLGNRWEDYGRFQ